MKKIIVFIKTFWLNILIFLISLTAIMPIICYFFYFHDSKISSNPEMWGAFGDFLGGSMSIPIFFSSIMIVYLARMLQKKDTYIERQKDAAHKLYKQCRLLKSAVDSNKRMDIISDYIILVDELDIYFEDSFVKKMRDLADKRIILDSKNIVVYTIDHDLDSIEKELKRIVNA